MNNSSASPVSVFADRAKLARLWFILFILACLGFALERVHLASALQRETQFIVMDADTYYLPRTLDFTAAQELHQAQVCIAAESLFDRGPSALDHPERLKRLFDKKSYLSALKRVHEESSEFETKKMHQKVEIDKIQLLQVKDSSVLTAFDGQLIRSGVFDGRPFVEVLAVTGRLTFERNSNMLVNGAYPTVVKEFQIESKPVKSK